MRRALILLLGLGLLGASCGIVGADEAEPATPGEGVTVVAARANWSSGYMQAEIYGQLLAELGYTVEPASANELAPADFYAKAAAGEVDFWPNGWFPTHDEFLAEVDGAVRRVGVSIQAGALQGYLADLRTAENRSIDTMDDLTDPDLAKLFDIDGNGKADLIGCNEGWGCQAIIDSHIETFGWGDTVEQVSGDYNELMAEVVERYENGDPVLFYTWTPNFTLGRLRAGRDVSWLGAPSLPGEDTIAEGVAGCAVDPCEMGWAPNDIGVVANSAFLDANPAAASVLASVRIEVDDVLDQNLTMQQGEDTPEDIARHAAEWIAANRDLVDGWLEAARAAA